MPIFEYRCQTCERRFETLVTGQRTPSCPSCHGTALEKQLSVFAVSTASRASTPVAAGSCGACGDPRGPGACNLN